MGNEKELIEKLQETLAREILIEFEKLGYVIDNDEFQCDMEHKYNNKNILINKTLKVFGCCQRTLKPHKTIVNGTEIKSNFFPLAEPSVLSAEELKLLYELFKIWGWFE